VINESKSCDFQPLDDRIASGAWAARLHVSSLRGSRSGCLMLSKAPSRVNPFRKRDFPKRNFRTKARLCELMDFFPYTLRLVSVLLTRQQFKI